VVVVHACHPGDGKKPQIEGLLFKLAWARSKNLSPK
jgi:hypothetical protein